MIFPFKKSDESKNQHQTADSATWLWYHPAPGSSARRLQKGLRGEVAGPGEMVHHPAVKTTTVAVIQNFYSLFLSGYLIQVISGNFVNRVDMSIVYFYSCGDSVI